MSILLCITGTCSLSSKITFNTLMWHVQPTTVFFTKSQAAGSVVIIPATLVIIIAKFNDQFFDKYSTNASISLIANPRCHTLHVWKRWWFKCIYLHKLMGEISVLLLVAMPNEDYAVIVINILGVMVNLLLLWNTDSFETKKWVSLEWAQCGIHEADKSYFKRRVPLFTWFPSGRGMTKNANMFNKLWF